MTEPIFGGRAAMALDAYASTLRAWVVDLERYSMRRRPRHSPASCELTTPLVESPTPNKSEEESFANVIDEVVTPSELTPSRERPSLPARLRRTYSRFVRRGVAAQGVPTPPAPACSIPEQMIAIPREVEQILARSTSSWARLAAELWSSARRGEIEAVLVVGSRPTVGATAVSLALAHSLATRAPGEIVWVDAAPGGSMNPWTQGLVAAGEISLARMRSPRMLVADARAFWRDESRQTPFLPLLRQSAGPFTLAVIDAGAEPAGCWPHERVVVLLVGDAREQRQTRRAARRLANASVPLLGVIENEIPRNAISGGRLVPLSSPMASSHTGSRLFPRQA